MSDPDPDQQLLSCQLQASTQKSLPSDSQQPQGDASEQAEKDVPAGQETPKDLLPPVDTVQVNQLMQELKQIRREIASQESLDSRTYQQIHDLQKENAGLKKRVDQGAVRAQEEKAFLVAVKQISAALRAALSEGLAGLPNEPEVQQEAESAVARGRDWGVERIEGRAQRAALAVYDNAGKFKNRLRMLELEWKIRNVKVQGWKRAVF